VAVVSIVDPVKRITHRFSHKVISRARLCFSRIEISHFDLSEISIFHPKRNVEITSDDSELDSNRHLDPELDPNSRSIGPTTSHGQGVRVVQTEEDQVCTPLSVQELQVQWVPALFSQGQGQA
jgi:hypothetical protein